MGQKFCYNEINCTNILDYAPIVREIVEKAKFVAVDAEFSGIYGTGTRNSNIAERYISYADIVKMYSVVSLGISAFGTSGEASSANETRLNVHNFHLLLFCEPPHTVNPASVRFLADNGFDFNRCIRLGISYWPGSSKDPVHYRDEMCGRNWRFSNRDEAEEALNLNAALRDIVRTLFSSGTPLVTHNGLLDIMFLYHHFYSTLPPSLDKFVSDCASIFNTGGVYDSKYVAEFIEQQDASFLSYLFRKSERLNENRRSLKSGKFISVNFHAPIDLPQEHLLKRKRSPSIDNKQEICKSFARNGICYKGISFCEHSHSLAQVLDEKIGPAQHDQSHTLSEPAHSLRLPSASVSPRETYHSAVFDSYMTGYIFVFQLLEAEALSSDLKISSEFDAQIKNVLYIMGKNLPLKFLESNYV